MPEYIFISSFIWLFYLRNEIQPKKIEQRTLCQVYLIYILERGGVFCWTEGNLELFSSRGGGGRVLCVFKCVREGVPRRWQSDRKARLGAPCCGEAARQEISFVMKLWALWEESDLNTQSSQY